MFSESYSSEIRQYFDRQMILLENRREELKRKAKDQGNDLGRFSHVLLEQKIEEIRSVLSQCTPDEGEALRFLYSAMPLSDLLDYPATLYLAYARHGVYLWTEGPYGGKVPEKLFANYVLHHRVHNEDIADTRRFFYDRLQGRIQGKGMYDAVMETNRWCAENATYQTTFPRTQNPLTMFGTGAGRCGEEAPFVSTALRSLGIPARQVAAPWWAHCDDNHAWVEAWCDGKWHFFGGCEPGYRLDSGWFAGPASRAMLIDSVWFGKDQPLEPVAERPNMSSKLNHMALYAPTAQVKVKVVDEQGSPVSGARVEFQVLNYGKFGTVACLYTGAQAHGEEGTVKLDTGYGDLFVCVSAEDGYGEAHVSLAEEHSLGEGQPGRTHDVECVVALRKGLQDLDQWRDLDLRAPGDTYQEVKLTEEQAVSEEAVLTAAAECRRRKKEGFYQEREAERVLERFQGEERKSLEEILRQACSNMGEIVRFLEWDFAGRVTELVRMYGPEGWKLKALKTLHTNDYWDIRAEVLAECCICGSPYASQLPEDVFFSSLLAPGVANERPRACRAALEKAVGEGLGARIRRDPSCLSEELERLVEYLPMEEYANLVASPLGCLTGSLGSPLTRAVLEVNIYRALGIPARLRTLDRTVEYYVDGHFVSAAVHKEKTSGKLVLRAAAPLKLEDWGRYSLSRFENGHFQSLFLKGKKETSQQETALALESGLYRIATTNRLPDGGQLVALYDFELKENEEKHVEMIQREISGGNLTGRSQVEDMGLCSLQGEEVMLSSLSGEGRALLLWLELTREPTEHILNEMYESREQFAALGSRVCFVVRTGSRYGQDATLNRLLGVLPGAVLLTDDYGTAYEALAQSTGHTPGTLPLALVLKEGRTCVYSDSGYNVGMAETLLKMLLAE